MILKLKTKLKNLEGKEIEDVDVGQTLANIVLQQKSDPMRSYILSGDLWKKDEIELSKADLEYIKTAVTEKGGEVYTNALVLGQLLVILSELKD